MRQGPGSIGKNVPDGRDPRVYSAAGRAHRRAYGNACGDAGAARVTRRRFTVHEYHRMAEAGILHEDDRVELIEMAAIRTRHFTCVNGPHRFLVRSVGDEAIVSVQNPVRLDEYGEPQPDLAVIRPRDYRESLPTPEDVMLLIEVPDTTLAYDRDVKLPMYARKRIREAPT